MCALRRNRTQGGRVGVHESASFAKPLTDGASVGGFASRSTDEQSYRRAMRTGE